MNYKVILFIIFLLGTSQIAQAGIVSTTVTPKSIFKCQASSISAVFDDSSVTAVTAHVTSVRAVTPMIINNPNGNAPRTEETLVTLTWSGSAWTGTFGNDQNLLWGNRTITYYLTASPNATYTDSKQIQVYSDACEGVGMTSYQNTTTGLGQYTSMLFNSDIDLIDWVIYPWLMIWGYYFYAIIMFIITSAIYIKTRNVTYVYITILISLLSAASTAVIPVEFRQVIMVVIALIFATIFYKLFIKE